MATAFASKTSASAGVACRPQGKVLVAAVRAPLRQFRCQITDNKPKTHNYIIHSCIACLAGLCAPHRGQGLPAGCCLSQAEQLLRLWRLHSRCQAAEQPRRALCNAQGRCADQGQGDNRAAVRSRRACTQLAFLKYLKRPVLLQLQLGDSLAEFLVEATPDPKLRQLLMSMSEALRTIAYKVGTRAEP